MNTRDLDLSADMIDIRDIIARVEALRDERNGLQDFVQELADADEENEEAQERARTALADWVIEYGEELATLESILSDLEGNGGDEQWEGSWYPVTLIRDGNFERAMDEMLEDCGYVPKDLPSFLTIVPDYDSLQSDYTSIDIGSETYWYK